MSHLSLLLPFFFIIAQSAESDDSSQPNCPLYKCGDVAINYTFWKIDSESTAQFCGYPDFGINCTNIDGRIIPEIDLFHVQRTIKYSSILLADRDVFSVGPGANDCPRVRHGINLQTLPLSFLEVNVNLSFHSIALDSLLLQLRYHAWKQVKESHSWKEDSSSNGGGRVIAASAKSPTGSAATTIQGSYVFAGTVRPPRETA
ncbi:hypothetical protein L1987_12696 [Smallanthus sonchifolius]|uniref:Uncharacterized protein n=1 Tax=Smallanthus sonchifolius TaxID=185202 RepID=A0ACB9JGK7_9ASTR|nr:hypothetical protein L1987_12696 [Smallanthus sonchifolius]